MEYLGGFLGGGSGGGLNPFSALKQFDRNGDGRITEDDFLQVAHSFGLGSLGDGAIRAAFRRLDSNRNGSLDLSEALAAFETLQRMMSGGGGGAGGGHGGFGL